MTTVFKTAYESLLLDYLPRPVRTQRAYEQACRQIAKLMSGGPELPQAESELLEIFSLLVGIAVAPSDGARDRSAGPLACRLDLGESGGRGVNPERYRPREQRQHHEKEHEVSPVCRHSLTSPSSGRLWRRKQACEDELEAEIRVLLAHLLSSHE